MGNLWIDCRVVPSPIEIQTVAICRGVRRETIWQLARDEDGEPLVINNVLVGGNCELTGTVIEPLIIFV